MVQTQRCPGFIAHSRGSLRTLHRPGSDWHGEPGALAPGGSCKVVGEDHPDSGTNYGKNPSRSELPNPGFRRVTVPGAMKDPGAISTSRTP